MARIIIMGASSGMGLATAEALAKRGVKIGIAARHTETMRELKERYPDNVEYMSIDVTKPSAKEKLLELIEKVGGMDIYFHVAGIGFENLDLDPEREVEILKTNACGFVRMICVAYRYFRDRGHKGQIAAITSVAGTNGIGRLSAYSSSKALDQRYLIALEQLAHAEGADVRFTDIRPGWVKTPLLVPGDKYPMEMTVPYVIPQILWAIAKEKRVHVIDWRWNVAVGLWRMIPDAIWTRIKMPISKPDEPLPTPPIEPPVDPLDKPEAKKKDAPEKA
ncbi:MAG: SDR family NAD(P)-dependent oxidoreductase [Bacteroidales bacterium]|nr:SDR family NAD(P)-dependent oxidoreductase [Bacteroidales bacterium]